VQKFFDRLFDVIQPFQMAYPSVYFREEAKRFRYLAAPFTHLFGRKIPVERGVQLDSVELRGVVGQFIFGSPRVKILQLLPVPFCASYKYARRFGLPITNKDISCSGMIVR